MAKTTEDYIVERKETIEYMIGMYCRKKHSSTELCDQCSELLEYAKYRLDRCPNTVAQIPCSKCTHPCYKPDMRERMREVMRYSGPRMIRHPIIMIKHKLA